MGTSLIAFFVILAADFFPQWSGFQKMLVFLGVAVVLGILSDLCRPTQFVCILFVNEAGTEFGFKNPDYARLFAAANETVVKRTES